MCRLRLLHSSFVTVALLMSFAQIASADTSDYTLFNPTPVDKMREMTTDRPDKTESPHTVDAGHLQLEMDWLTYTYNSHEGTTQRTWNVAPFNLRVGVLNNVDVQFIFDNYIYTRQRNSANDTSETTQGVGDLTTRLKVNLWGNDGGDTAFALLPFLKIPTNSNGLGNNSYEGGLILPLSLELPRDFGLSMMTEIDILRDDDNSGNHTEFVNSASLSHDLTSQLGMYLEFYSSISSQDASEWVGTVDTGLTYALTENVQLDCGINIGVTDSADDLNPFTGISWRL